MINSRSPDDLTLETKKLWEAHKVACASVGIDIILTSTFRDYESQTALYNQGRTTPGHIVTNAKAGESYHNFHIAYDIVVIRNGKAVWDSTDPAWATVGKLGETVGLEWAGRWKSFKELAHFQLPGYNLAKLRELAANPQITAE